MDCRPLGLPRFRGHAPPPNRTARGNGMWPSSLGDVTRNAWRQRWPGAQKAVGASSPTCPSGLTVHPAFTFPAAPWWTWPWGLSPSTQLCLPWPQCQAPVQPGVEQTSSKFAAFREMK